VSHKTLTQMFIFQNYCELRKNFPPFDKFVVLRVESHPLMRSTIHVIVHRPTINRHVALLLPNTSKRHLKKRFSLLTFVSRAQQLVVVIPTILPQKPANSAICHFLICQLLLCHTPSLSTYSFPRTYHVHLFTTHARQVPILIGFNQPNYAISQVHVLLNSSNTLLSGRHIFLLNLQTFS
jgi:hypothetical protein